MGRAVKIAAFRDTLRTTNGTDDFTVSGLGANTDMKAVLLFGTHAGSGEDGTATDGASNNVGMAVSSTNRRVIGMRITHNDLTNTDGHREASTGCYGRMGLAAQSWGHFSDFNSFITNGFRLDCDTTVTKALYLHGLIFSGADVQADIKTVTVAQTVNGTSDVAISFEPNLIIGLTNGDQFDDNSAHDAQAGQTIAFIKNHKNGTVDHACQTVIQRGDIESGLLVLGGFGQVSNSRIVLADPTLNTTTVDWEFTVSFPNSSTIRVTTNVVGSDPAAPEIGFLLIDTSDVDVCVGIMDVPTATGDKTFGASDFAPDINWIPQAMLFAVSQITAINTFRSGSAEACTMGLAVVTRPASVAAGNVEFCSTTSNENGDLPTDSQSLSDDQLFHVPPDDGTSANRVKATFTAFTSGGFTANFSEVPSSALKWPFLAIEQEAGGQPAVKRMGGVQHAHGGYQHGSGMRRW